MSKKHTSFGVMACLIGLVKPMLYIMLCAIVFGMTGYLCAIFIPVLGAEGIMTAAGVQSAFSLRTIFVLIAVAAVLRGLLRYAEQACNHYIAFRLLAVIRDKVFTSLRRLCPAKLESRDRGDLIALITGDVELLEVFYAHTISPVAIAATVSLIMVIFIGCISPVLAIISLCAYIAVGLVIPLYNSGKTAEPGAEYREASSRLNSLFLEGLRGLRELLQYGKTGLRAREISEETKKLAYIRRRLNGREISSASLTDFAVMLFNLIFLIVSVLLCRVDAVSPKDAVIAVVALMSSYGPVLALSNLSNSLAQTLASGERVLSLLDEQPETADITDGADLDFDDVSCRSLSFSYGGADILRNIDFSAERGRITGILGKSGCGKSTLLKLIMRFWERSGGELCLSGTPIERINTNCLRRRQSYCTQETYLFNDTIGNNIRIARPDATMEEVTAAAEAASVHEFISQLSEGYDTPVGELGDRLSGGERQRIGLARAFLSNSALMLLDEPTSNLDSLNEAIILRSLKNARGKTVILVSHRRSTLAIADNIYEMKSGRPS